MFIQSLLIQNASKYDFYKEVSHFEGEIEEFFWYVWTTDDCYGQPLAKIYQEKKIQGKTFKGFVAFPLPKRFW